MGNQSLNDVFKKKCSKPHMENFDANKRLLNYKDKTLFLDLLNMVDHGMKNKQRF